jgi:hypothetical protein
MVMMVMVMMMVMGTVIPWRVGGRGRVPRLAILGRDCLRGSVRCIGLLALAIGVGSVTVRPEL